jgi:hypothetical protein
VHPALAQWLTRNDAPGTFSAQAEAAQPVPYRPSAQLELCSDLANRETTLDKRL